MCIIFACVFRITSLTSSALEFLALIALFFSSNILTTVEMNFQFFFYSLVFLFDPYYFSFCKWKKFFFEVQVFFYSFLQYLENLPIFRPKSSTQVLFKCLGIHRWTKIRMALFEATKFMFNQRMW